MRKLLVGVALVIVAGCGGSKTGVRESGGVRSSARAGAKPGAVNVLPGGTSAAPATSSTPAASTSTVSPAPAPSPLPSPSPAPSTSTSTSTIASSTSPGTGTGTGTTAVAPAPTGARLKGTIPASLTTGFDGTLYFAGEGLQPGSVFEVSVNGVFTKFLPATFHASDLLATYVYLTVAADYTFVAIAPDGSRSTPATFTVAAGTPQALVGLTAPDVQMMFPTRLETTTSGVVWLLGDQFMPGAVVTVQQAGLPAFVAPLVVLNERTAGWPVLGLVQGTVTLTVTNPTLLSSTPVTVAVGPAPPTGATPRAMFPPGVVGPFLGSVHVVGGAIEVGAVVEHRLVGATTSTSTPLARVSPAEAWWPLLYPAAGTYEVRVVNPGGAASAWSTFDVR
jgi:hypothetical protein